MAAAAMAMMHDTAKRALVVGLGATGLSCTRFLLANGFTVSVVDSRADPPMKGHLRQESPNVPVYLGGFERAPWDNIDMVVVSPGVALGALPLQRLMDQGVDVVGDVELFARHVEVPVVAVTGSNGKSTVTSLAGAMCQGQGIASCVAGNIGTPVLDTLGHQPDPELYVLELSSFQLETTSSLACVAAAVLNVSEDHMDRYPDLDAYKAAKARIFARCEKAIVNRDDPHSMAMVPGDVPAVTFGTDPPQSAHDYGIAMTRDGECLVRGEQILLSCEQIPLLGRHNHANVLAAMALAEAAGVDDASMVAATVDFTGLPHRMQTVADINGVRYINDSKGTNVGATNAALLGLTQPVVLIAGGDGKGADFSLLRHSVAQKVRAVVLIGRDAGRIEAAIGGAVPTVFAGSMDEAVLRAQSLAIPGDAVLLSPACASFDMFNNYVARGEAFCAAVRGLQV